MRYVVRSSPDSHFMEPKACLAPGTYSLVMNSFKIPPHKSSAKQCVSAVLLRLVSSLRLLVILSQSTDRFFELHATKSCSWLWPVSHLGHGMYYTILCCLQLGERDAELSDSNYMILIMKLFIWYILRMKLCAHAHVGRSICLSFIPFKFRHFCK
jgi:hypothetical protein